MMLRTTPAMRSQYLVARQLFLDKNVWLGIRTTLGCCYHVTQINLVKHSCEMVGQMLVCGLASVVGWRSGAIRTKRSAAGGCYMTLLRFVGSICWLQEIPD